MGKTKKDRRYRRPDRSCPSGKWAYVSRSIAERLKKKMADREEPMIVYACRDCGHWHLSSQQRRRRK